MKSEQCQCRMCVMNRWRAINKHRRITGNLPQLPKPEIPFNRAGRKVQCRCPVCVANRESYRKRKLTDGPCDADLDRIALAKWNSKWGARA